MLCEELTLEELLLRFERLVDVVVVHDVMRASACETTRGGP